MHQKIRRFAAWSLSASAAIVVATLATTPVRAQTLYGTLTGNVTDAQGANIPGATVSIRNENTGLELTAVTDETGTYTIRNIAGGTYTLKASLQGFKEFVQTGISVIVGSIVRINGRLEIGALSESVTVTSEAAHPQDRQGRRQRRPSAGRCHQPAAEPVPQLSDAAEPGSRRHAARVPERADRHAGPRAEHQHQRHEPQQQRDAHRRRRQHQRLAAASRGLRRAGRDDRERQHLDQQLRRGAGHDRRRGHGRPDQVGHQQAQGLGVLLPPAGRAQRPPRLFRSDQARLERLDHGRHGRRSDPPNQLFFFGSWERNDERNARFNTYTVPTAKMRNGDFSEVLALEHAFRIYDPATGNPDGTGRSVFAERDHSRQSHQRHLQEDPGDVPGAEQPRHEQRPPEQSVRRAVAEGDSRQLRRQDQLEPHVRAPDLGQGLGDGRRRAGPVLPAVRRRRRWRHDGHPLDGRADVDAEPDAAPRRQRRVEQDDPSVAGAGLRHQLRPRDVRHSRA